MVRFVLSLACMLVAGNCFGQCSGVASSCSGARATPVRNVIAAKPVATILSKICSAAQSRRSAACNGQRASSCSGSAVPMAPAPQAGSCGCANCKCADCNCGDAMQPVASSAYSQALASAQYRAANRIRGHSYLDTHRTSGVGWASSNSKPNTCLGGDNRASYASVRGADGWYSTKF